MKIPTLLSSNQVGNGRVSNEFQSGVYWKSAKTIRQHTSKLIRIQALHRFILSICGRLKLEKRCVWLTIAWLIDPKHGWWSDLLDRPFSLSVCWSLLLEGESKNYTEATSLVGFRSLVVVFERERERRNGMFAQELQLRCWIARALPVDWPILKRKHISKVENRSEREMSGKERARGNMFLSCHRSVRFILLLVNLDRCCLCAAVVVRDGWNVNDDEWSILWISLFSTDQKWIQISTLTRRVRV